MSKETKMLSSPITLKLIDLAEDHATLKYQNVQLYSKVRFLQAQIKLLREEMSDIDQNLKKNLSINSVLTQQWTQLNTQLDKAISLNSDGTKRIKLDDSLRFLKPLFSSRTNQKFIDVTKSFFVKTEDEDFKLELPLLSKELSQLVQPTVNAVTSLVTSSFPSTQPKKSDTLYFKALEDFKWSEERNCALQARSRYLEEQLEAEKLRAERYFDLFETARQRLNLYKTLGKSPASNEVKTEADGDKKEDTEPALSKKAVELQSKIKALNKELKEKDFALKEKDAQISTLVDKDNEKYETIQLLRMDADKPAASSVQPSVVRDVQKHNEELVFCNKEMQAQIFEFKNLLQKVKEEITERFKTANELLKKENDNLKVKLSRQEVSSKKGEIELKNLTERYQQTKKMLMHYKNKSSKAEPVSKHQSESDIAKELDAVSKKYTDEAHRLNKTRHQLSQSLKDNSTLRVKELKASQAQLELTTKSEKLETEIKGVKDALEVMSKQNAALTKTLESQKETYLREIEHTHEIRAKANKADQLLQDLQQKYAAEKSKSAALASENRVLNSSLTKVSREKKDASLEANIMKQRVSSLRNESADVSADIRLASMRNSLACPVNNAYWKDCVLRRCGHIFAKKSLLENLEKRNRKCPTCKETYNREDFIDVFLYQKNI